MKLENMLSSINFLLLLSLGFISWFIICYIEQIEKFIKSDVDLQQEIPKKEIFPETKPEPIVQSTNPTQKNYDSYINFLGIFICVYALAKITQRAEMYMAKRIRRKVCLPTAVQESDDDDFETLSNLQEQQESLKCKINKLEKQNQEIKLKLKKVVDNDPVPILATQNADEKIHNVIIKNKHIHLNRQIYVNTSGISFDREKSEPENVWNKYLKLNDSMNFKTNAEMTTPMPVVMSSDDLRKIKAIF
ncbi:uncharacterized protein ACRADG_003482 [Cochliomyia hominivorax]